jgi:hypothetical protein
MKTEETKATETEITVKPKTTQILLTWKSRDSGIVLMSEDVPTELTVVAVGPDVKNCVVGEKVICGANGGVTFLKIKGNKNFCLIYESALKLEITEPGTVEIYDPRHNYTDNNPLA